MNVRGSSEILKYLPSFATPTMRSKGPPALPKLKRGGLLVTDNTLWSGKAARPAASDDQDTRGVQEFNRLVYASKELFPVLIPLRDGVTVCRKT